MASSRRICASCSPYVKRHLFRGKENTDRAPKDGQGAHSEELKAALQQYESETEDHVERLDKAFAEPTRDVRGRLVMPSWALSRKGRRTNKYKASLALDVWLLARTTVEHYEISRYGS